VLIALNTSVRSDRRRLRLLLSTLVGLSVLAAHGAVGGAHMGPPAGEHTMTDGGHTMTDVLGAADGSVHALMAMCLAITETAALAFSALALAGALAALLALIASVRRPVWPLVVTPRVALAPRARPPDLSVLQVFRR